MHKPRLTSAACAAAVLVSTPAEISNGRS